MTVSKYFQNASVQIICHQNVINATILDNGFQIAQNALTQGLHFLNANIVQISCMHFPIAPSVLILSWYFPNVMSVNILSTHSQTAPHALTQGMHSLHAPSV